VDIGRPRVALGVDWARVGCRHLEKVAKIAAIVAKFTGIDHIDSDLADTYGPRCETQGASAIRDLVWGSAGKLLRRFLGSSHVRWAVTRRNLVGIRLPIAWTDFGFPVAWRGRSTTVATGPPAWSWDGPGPAGGVDAFTPPDDPPSLEDWEVDHVVLLVPDIEAAVSTLRSAGCDLRLRITVRARPTAFFRVGTLLEVIETAVPAPRLYGIALVTNQDLDEVAAGWRTMGHDVPASRDAVQPGRRIITVRDAGAGLAVMSPEGAG
jgi:hypothetical protein